MSNGEIVITDEVPSYTAIAAITPLVANETDPPYEVGFKKPPKGTQFKKGDTRINRKGRPKQFDAWRKLVVDMLAEPAVPTNAEDTSTWTKAYTLARRLYSSDSSQDKKMLVEYAFGKVPDEIELAADINTDSKVIIEYVNDWRG